MQPAPKEKDSKVRVFALAKELSVELKREIKSKELLDYCKSLGFEGITNQFHGLENDQISALREQVKKGPQAKANAPAAPVMKAPVMPPPGKIERTIQTLPKAKSVVKSVEEPAPVEPLVPVAVVETPEPAPVPVMENPKPVQEPELKTAEEPEVPVTPEPSAPVNVIPQSFTMGSNRPMNLSGRTPNLSKPVPPRPVSPPPAAPKPVSPPPMQQQQRPNTGGPGAPMGPRPPMSGAPGSPRSGVPGQRSNSGTGGPKPPPPQPGPPKPTTMIGGKGAPQVKPPSSLPGQVKLTPEMMQKIRDMSQRGQKVDIRQVAKTGDITTGAPRGDRGAPPGGPRGPRRDGDAPRGPGTAAPGTTGPRPDRGPSSGGSTNYEDDDKKKKGGTGVIGRDSRHRARQDRGGRGSDNANAAVIIGADGSVDLIEQKSGSRRGPRAALIRKMRGRQQMSAVKKEGPVEIAFPITVRSLSEAIGMKAGEVILRLKKETQKIYVMNSNIEFDVAELIAVDKGINLVQKKQETAESKLLEAYERRANEVDPALLVPRAPVVTIMGHVDHGKTSLLDKIRQEFGLHSDVVSTEAGGITQVIRAWQVEKDDRRITFLDTPGHEAFTKMRARGAKVTDIVVIVVAATDGVMPQTEEAINHALAADVDIIVAINKIDMPNANLDKTRRQLYSLNLLPDDMGGDVPFVETSAVTGEGISELLNTIILMAELSEHLKADPAHPASGTCLEAYLEGQEGVMATLLVQQGTLRKGDVVLCGSSFGRVRAMYDDHGVLITEAGPSTPVKITGLDEVPDADDPFYAVEDISSAREIAEQRKSLRSRASQVSFAPVSLESLTAAKTKEKITELKVILKAEARGSVEAIKKELEKLVHEEVRCRVLHSGIGAITESDVILGLTSPNDTIIIGFNVTADDAALRLSEARKIPLREYDIIYKLTDDVKAALEGKLKPIEEVVHLGRAVVREAFKITKVGTIAGCYVTSGVIERNAQVRIIRQGVVIFPHGEKVIGLDSLKRFKEDVKEVREGFECGVKITAFDDVKVDDVIEAYKIEIKMRTL